jgi:hypothetical protein
MFSSLEPLAPEPEQAEGLIAQAGGPADTQLANMAEQLEQQLFITFRRQVDAASVQRRRQVTAATVPSRRQVTAATVPSRRQVTAATVQSRRQVITATVHKRRRTEEKDL